MDPSLMTPEEIEARGRVIVDPCHRESCRHLRRAHVRVPRIQLEWETDGAAYLPPITGCLICDCEAFDGEPE